MSMRCILIYKNCSQNAGIRSQNKTTHKSTRRTVLNIYAVLKIKLVLFAYMKYALGSDNIILITKYITISRLYFRLFRMRCIIRYSSTSDQHTNFTTRIDIKTENDFDPLPVCFCLIHIISTKINKQTHCTRIRMGSKFFFIRGNTYPNLPISFSLKNVF